MVFDSTFYVVLYILAVVCESEIYGVSEHTEWDHNLVDIMQAYIHTVC